MDSIKIINASHGNLKNISLSIPKNKLTVVCGISGSGKSTLAVDVLFQECQRQYLEALGMQGIKKPAVEAIKNVSPAILIGPGGANNNPRSSLGTVTDIYTELRMIYEKLGTYPCSQCGQLLHADECREETEKVNDEFHVYMYCTHCGSRIPKLTRTHFSYNTREGACPACQGLGHRLDIRPDAVVDKEKSLEDGAVALWEYRMKDYMVAAIAAAFAHYGLPYAPGTPFGRLLPLQQRMILHGVEDPEVRAALKNIQPPKTLAAGRLPGVIPSLYKKLEEKGGLNGRLKPYFTDTTCSVCHGERLSPASRAVTVAGRRLPELSALSLEELGQWLQALSAGLSTAQRPLVDVYLLDLQTKINRLLRVGLGYLSLNRQTMTLSGGEAQRIRLAAALDSELTGIIYILDEPTRGLHAQDTAGVIETLKHLRDKENTVIVIEHDMDVLLAADHMLEIGPGAGKYGGTVTACGPLDEVIKGSLTGKYMRPVGRNSGGVDPRGNPLSLGGRNSDGEALLGKTLPLDGHNSDGTASLGNSLPPDDRNSDGIAPLSPPRRIAKDFLEIRHARNFNLQDISASFGIGLFNVVTGVSGSGKSTLVFEELCHNPHVTGLHAFGQIITVEQAAITRMKRSNIATFTGAFAHIRDIFAALPQSAALGLGTRHFSFNAKGGRCENCEGLGTITSNMLFFEDMEVICPVCGGLQFHEDVLGIKYKGYSIHDVLCLSIDEAEALFSESRKLKEILGLLKEVGLGYITLGQSLTTLSGGELQRLKLSRELLTGRGERRLYLIDEPTTGLHPQDIGNFVKLLHRLCDEGNTLIVVEHNLQLIGEADWVVDLGPQGGIHGGQVMAMGTPEAIAACTDSVTGRYLADAGILQAEAAIL